MSPPVRSSGSPPRGGDAIEVDVPRSSIAKTIESPSQIGSRISGYGSHVRSSDAVRIRRFSPVSASTTAICGWRGKSNPPGSHLTASSFPSGE